MPSPMRDIREIEGTASRGFTRFYWGVFGVGALIGLVIGIVWVIAGLLHFHPLW
jgi:hypothetical protein